MNRLFILFLLPVTLLSGCATTEVGQNDINNVRELLYKTPEQSIDLSNIAQIRHTLSAVNFEVNQAIDYEYDHILYGQDDYWASPSEVLKLGLGDCEDYAFLKREILINLGIPKARLKLIHGDVKEVGAYASRVVSQHIVLGYFPTSQSFNPIILDNMHNRLMFLKNRSDFRLNYVFDERNVWQSIASTNEDKVYNTDILPKFAHLRERRTAE